MTIKPTTLNDALASLAGAASALEFCVSLDARRGLNFAEVPAVSIGRLVDTIRRACILNGQGHLVEQSDRIGIACDDLRDRGPADRDLTDEVAEERADRGDADFARLDERDASHPHSI